MDYVRSKVHKLVGNNRFIQIVLHDSENVNPHLHFIHCGKSSPPRTNCMSHFIKYYCHPYRPIIHGSYKFTAPIAAAYRHQLLQLYLVGCPGYHPVVFQIASQGSNPVVHTGYDLFPSTTVDEESRKPETYQEEVAGCSASYSKGGLHQIRKRKGAMEPGLDGTDADTNDHSTEDESEQSADEERRTLLRRALQQKKKPILLAPTPLELSSLAIELYVTSIEILEYFKYWQQKFIKLALKEQRLRENIFQSSEVIVDLETKKWQFEDIGRHVFKHNNYFPSEPLLVC